MVATSTYIELDNRMFRIKEKSSAGFVKLISLAGMNAYSVMTTIGHNDNTDDVYKYIQKALDTIKDTEVTDKEIAMIVNDALSPVKLETILNTCQRLVAEELPISNNQLVADMREFLKSMNIECDQKFLFDYMYSIAVFDRSNEEILSYMHQNFEWSNDIGVKAWNCLLNKVRHNSIMKFYVKDCEDVCIIDLQPDMLRKPRFTKYTEANKKSVKAFVEMFRKGG